jgi:diguanylate cyclase (GGDEF)-like protein
MSATHASEGEDASAGERLVEIVAAPAVPDDSALTPADVLARMTEAEDTLRAIGAGEVDAFVVSDGGTGRRVFTLSTADRTYRRFVESMRDGAATISSGGLILFANQRLAALLSSSVETIVGSPLAMFVVGGVPEWEMTLGPGGLGATLELELVDSSGATVPVLAGASPLEIDGDDLICVTFADLSAQKEQEREIARLSEAQAERMVELQDAQTALTEQATHDALTGLPNRGLLFDRANQALFRAKRSGLCTALLFVDLDAFKQVNDTRGHAAGDAVLQTVANRLVAVLRPMDTVARIGGDEFVVLAPDIASEMDAIQLSERIMAELCRPDETADDDHSHFAASVGISVSVGGRGTAEILLNEADTAMYQAKALGGARAEVFDAALGRQIRERSTAQRMLQTALDERRIIVHYQPILDLATGSVAGFEALARITVHDGPLIHPAAFIRVAEDSGLVVPLGAQVLATGCREMRDWQSPERPEHKLTVAANISPRQFQHDLTMLVRETLEQTGLDPACLHLELTETAVMDLRPEVLQQLEQITDLGVEIGLDDFGTGYASLTHLRRLPLSFVKIDQSFVQGTGRDDERIVSAVVDLARNLGLRSIAEGVETEEQLDRLRTLGCDQAQGFLFAHPVPESDVQAVLDHPSW